MGRAPREFLSLETMAAKLVRAASGSAALIVVVAFLFTWLLLGPLSGFSTAWQSAISVPTSAVTFLMVFVILRVQNKAIHCRTRRNYRAIPPNVIGKISYCIYGDRLAFGLWKKKQVIVLRNDAVVETFRAQFNYLWKLAKPLRG